MKKRLNSLILIIYAFLFMGFTLTPVNAANVTLGVPVVTQEHSQWCWDAASKAVLDYYRTSVTQCAIANWAWSRSDCCGNTVFNWSHLCNQPNSMTAMQAVLNHWWVGSTVRDYAFTWSTVVSEINAKRPFIMRFGWTGGGGHALTGYGYDNVATPGYVNYMDPWPGNGYTKALYTTTVSDANHRWTHTLQVTTNPSFAQVTSLYPVSNAQPGQTRTLWAYVKNTGSYTLPSNATVWYWVRGPGIDKWVGSASAASIAAGASKWSGLDWTVPATAAPGNYYYWAIVYLGSYKPISPWSSSQYFPVGASAMISPANGATFASTTQTFTWSNVGAPQYHLYIGTSPAAYNIYNQSMGTATSRTVYGLPNTGINLYVRLWTYRNSTWMWNDYTYRAYNSAGFNSQFNGTAPNWIPAAGAWSIYSNAYYYTAGRAGYYNISQYNQVFTNLDYSARLWRSGSVTGLANFLTVRGIGSALADGDLYSSYRFQYAADGTFSVYKRVAGGAYTALKPWTASAAIIKGAAWNTLRVKAFGSSHYFYINGTLVWSGSDSSLGSGRVGVGMFRSTTSTSDGLWADWATLTIPSSQAVGGDGIEEDVLSGDVQDAFENEESSDRDVNGEYR